MNKLKFKIADVAISHGLLYPTALATALKAKGFKCSPALSARLWKGNFKQISIETIEKLCDLFDCVPSDLYTYPPKSKPVIASESRPVASESEKADSVRVMPIITIKADKSMSFDNELNKSKLPELPALDDPKDFWQSTKEIADGLNRDERTVRDFYKQGLAHVKTTKGNFVKYSDLTKFWTGRSKS